MFWKKKDDQEYNIENAYKDELIKKLKEENENLKSQLKFENQITSGVVLQSGEYIVGKDLKPGRYSLKLIYGNDGRLETTGRNWVIETLGDKWNGITEYRNLNLKMEQKLRISGNVKILLQEEKPVNFNEDISVIDQKNNEIKRLKEELAKVKKEYSECKEQFNSKYIEENFTMTVGLYKGGENIKIGYYDLEVISGSGVLRVPRRNVYIKMGTKPNETQYFKGLKITAKMNCEITGNLVINAIHKNIQEL